MKSIRNKNIVVTGAGKSNLVGYGAQIAKALYEAGARVHILGRKIERLNETKKWAGAEEDGNFRCYACDVSDPIQVKDVFEQIREESGLIYGLVNNAAINPSRNNIENTSLEDFDATIKTNLYGAFHCIKAAIIQMKELGEGSIVNITSIFAHVGGSNQTSYCPSKFALDGLTKSVALAYARHGINANCVSPGYAKTDLTAPLLDRLTEEKYASLIKSHAIRREIKPQEVADATSFLLRSDLGTTAQTIKVDGGFTQNPSR